MTGAYSKQLSTEMSIGMYSATVVLVTYAAFNIGLLFTFKILQNPKIF